jgi:NAD-dependent deacetylase
MPPVLADVAPLSRFRHVTVLTGAGVSVASGLPTYRGADGLYTDPELEAAMYADALPGSLPTVWRVWGGLFRAARAAGPNAAHHALADAEAALGARGGTLTVITTNVDGLHTDAGSAAVHELHGHASSARCLDDVHCRTFTPLTVDTELPTPCRRCGGKTRPSVVLFGEQLPRPTLQAAERAASNADLFLSVGTSAVVWPANALVGVAKANGALCVSLTAETLTGEGPAFDHLLIGRAELELPAWAATA